MLVWDVCVLIISQKLSSNVTSGKSSAENQNKENGRSLKYNKEIIRTPKGHMKKAEEISTMSLANDNSSTTSSEG